MTELSTEGVSSKVFGNARYAAVVCALDRHVGPATAQDIAKRTGLNYSVVRDVVVRLADVGVLRKMDRLNLRAPQPYVIEHGELWRALVLTSSIIMRAEAP